ncbi:MAG: TonB-dependent receptor plug domain-containing protein [Gemmatimonadaceae bacterium]|nr:TonB-dependent receptor plug domain-containing protein [Gemmatimonadaceae bacterium]
MNRHNTLEGREIDGRAVARVEELFVGRFPGVQVFQEAGGMTVRIRGTSTVNGNGEPLIILDDYQMSPGTGGLVAINPRDVASIEVLKDAVSIAQYGVLGANGIIRITTKKPK